MDKIREIQKEQLRKSVPDFGPGDTVRVHYKIKEGDKERVQIFQGTVLQRRGEGISHTFTVRKISNGIGVERIFPLHSPFIQNIDVVRKGRVRRAKLFYLRQRKGKATRIAEKE